MRPMYRYANSVRLIAVLLLLLAQLPSPTVKAVSLQDTSTVITDCTEAGLEAALAVGGPITFNCGGPATISITSEKQITKDTSIDGSNNGSPVVLNAVEKVSILRMEGPYQLALSHLTLQNGYAPQTSNWRVTTYGGALVARGGTITVDSVRFYKNGAGQGGAIDYDNTSTGSLIIRNSIFEENIADGNFGYQWGNGGAISTNAPTVIIENSTFKNNTSTQTTGGAVYSTGASLSISASIFEGNKSQGEGGAVNFAPGAATSTLTVRDSHFRSNQAIDWLGGGLSVSCNGPNPVVATIERTDFVGNSATHGSGGGLSLVKNTVLYADHLTFDHNMASGNGGGLSSEGATGWEGTLTNSVFIGNRADLGGGGASIGGPMLVQNNRIENNQAPLGGGIQLGQTVSGADIKLHNNVITGNLLTGASYNNSGSAMYISTGDPVEISGNTLTGNKQEQNALMNGGVIGIWTAGKVVIKNNTIANNFSQRAFATVVFSVGGGYTLSYNTIVNNTGDAPSVKTYYTDGLPQILEGNILVNQTPSECNGYTVTNGYNLFSDTSCGTAAGDVVTTAPGLGGLSDNGGPTQTFNLYENSPAINTGGATCPVTADQRGVARPVGSACDIGAVEADHPLPVPPPPPPLPVLTHNSYTSSDLPPAESRAMKEVTFRGDPVNTIFGNFTYQHIDMMLPGVFPVSMQRAYNSAASADGLMGYGWNINFDLRVNDPRSSQPDADQVVIKRGDGRQDYYTVSGEDLVPPAGSREILVKLPEGGYTLTTRQFIVYRFNSAGRLVSAADPSGNTLTFTYTGEQCTGVQDDAGRAWAMAYNEAGRLSSLTDPSGRTVQYAYDTNSNLTQVTNPAGGVTHYAYDSTHRITQITDPDGKLIAAMQYDPDGRVTLQTDARGDHHYVYTAGQTLYTDPTGLVTAIRYNEQYQVTENIQGFGTPEAISSKMSYDPSGFLAAQTNGRGNTTTYLHDAEGNITQTIDALGQVTKMTYDTRGNLLTRTDPLDHTATYTYNGANQVLTITNPAGAVTTNAYDTRGLLTSQTDALGKKTEFTYDSAGSLLTVTDALGGQVKYQYDSAGRVTQITDALGAKTTYTYNALDQVLTQTAPDDGETSYTYSLNGSLLTQTDPLGHTTTYTYTAANDLASVEDALGGKTSFTYDAMGRRISEKQPDGSTWTNTYDPFGRLISRKSPLGHTTRYTYDPAGNLLTASDPAGGALTYTYDALNQLTGVNDALGGQTTYAYDAAGRLVSVTDALKHTTTYTYDALGRRTGETEALGHTTRYQYDALGRLIERQNAAGQKVTYSYDALGRLLSATGSGVNASFTYNKAGQRTSMTDTLGKADYTYDAAGRVTAVSGPQGSVSYTYDKAGNRTAMTQPGTNLAYTYDAINRLTGLSLGSTSLAQYTYNANGLNASQTRSNGAVTTLSYDADSRLVGMQIKLGQSSLLKIDYTLDSRGNRTTETTQVQGAAAFSAVYAYDVAGRLVSASLQVPTPEYKLYIPTLMNSAAFAQSAPKATLPEMQALAGAELQALEYAYTYDAAGNRLTVKENGSTTSYTYNAAGQISSAGYTYDAAGRLTSDGANTYTYDGLNRITAISGKVTASYVYDGDGNRVRETVSGLTTDYLLDTALALPVRIAAMQNGKVTRSFFGLGLVAQSLPDGTLQYLHADGLGSIRLVTGSDGQVLGHASYAPFGNLLEGSLPAAFGFTGEPGTGAGLVHLRARDYSPALGRFLAPDLAQPQLSDPQTLNRYAYVRNSPINLTDPSGLCWFGICEVFSGIGSAMQSAVQATVSAVQSGVQAVASFISGDSRPSSSPLAENSINSCSLTNNLTAGIVSRDTAGIVSRDGAGIVSRDGAGIVSRDGASLIGQAGGTLIGQAGGTLIGQAGGTLIGQAGGTLIGQAGGTLISQARLISDKGLGLISDKGLGLISDKGLG